MSVCYATDVSTTSQNVFNDNVTYTVCRICLAKDVKMKKIAEDYLDKCYRQVTGLGLKHNDQLPQVLCWECAGRIKTADILRDKALKSYILLSKIANKNNGITIGDVNLIDREENMLRTSLVLEKCDFYISGDDFKTEPIEIEFSQEEIEGFDEKINVKIDQCDRDENKIEEISHNLHEDFDNVVSYEFKVDRETSDNDVLSVSYEVDGNTLDDTETKDSIEVAKEGEVLSHNVELVDISDIKFKPVNTGSDKKDPNECLDKKKAARKTRSQKVGNTRKKVQPKKSMLLKKSQVSKLPEKKGKTNETDKSELKRFFTITPVTFEEQKAEIEKRKESAWYKIKPYQCTICYSGFSSKAIYDVHCIKHSEKKGNLECFVCKKRFQKKKYLSEHISSKHTESYSCKSCKFVTTCSAKAKEHQKRHTDLTYDCKQCPQQFRFYTSYVTHLRLKHSSPFVCNLCGYTFVSEYGVECHKLRKHSDSTEEIKGPFCDKCNMRFATEDAYKRHLRLSSQHMEDDDLNYSESLRNEPSRDTLADYRRRRIFKPSSTEPVTCEQCGLVVAGFRAYTGHFRSCHPGLARTVYCQLIQCICEHCGRSFTSKHRLLEHMNVHTKKEEYKCGSCERVFQDKAQMRAHKKTHRNVKYPCPHCDQQFTLRTNCTRHILTVHEGLKKYTCDQCGQTVTTSTNLKQHIAFVHNKLPRPKRVRRRVPRTAPAPASRTDVSGRITICCVPCECATARSEPRPAQVGKQAAASQLSALPCIPHCAGDPCRRLGKDDKLLWPK